MSCVIFSTRHKVRFWSIHIPSQPLGHQYDSSVDKQRQQSSPVGTVDWRIWVHHDSHLEGPYLSSSRNTKSRDSYSRKCSYCRNCRNSRKYRKLFMCVDFLGNLDMFTRGDTITTELRLKGSKSPCRGVVSGCYPLTIFPTPLRLVELFVPFS
jgi:hypothetical protein